MLFVIFDQLQSGEFFVLELELDNIRSVITIYSRGKEKYGRLSV